jgi:hypothetical protein
MYREEISNLNRYNSTAWPRQVGKSEVGSSGLQAALASSRVLICTLATNSTSADTSEIPSYWPLTHQFGHLCVSL